jgi:uroporphyrinogen III methyltransferase / synthase
MTAILVTRPRGSANPLVDELRRRGYRVYEVPTVEIEPAPVELHPLEGFDWVVFTSARGVSAIPSLPSGPRFAVVGEATAAALRARGIEPAHIPPHANARSLAETLPDVAGSRIAIIQASASESELADVLKYRGSVVEEVTGYRTVIGPEQSAERLQVALADPELAAVAFASGSAVRGFLALGGSPRLAAITIGPRTSDVARAHGFEVVAESDEQTTEAFAATISVAVPLKEPRNA